MSTMRIERPQDCPEMASTSAHLTLSQEPSTELYMLSARLRQWSKDLRAFLGAVVSKSSESKPENSETCPTTSDE